MRARDGLGRPLMQFVPQTSMPVAADEVFVCQAPPGSSWTVTPGTSRSGTAAPTAASPYDFGAADLAGRARAATFDLAVPHPPPPELLFIQRTLGGTYMLCARLRARIDSGTMFRRFLAGAPLASLAT